MALRESLLINTSALDVTSMTPLTHPIEKESESVVNLELSDISHINIAKEEDWMDKVPVEFSEYIEEKLQDFDLESADAALQLFYAKKGKIDLNEIQHLRYGNGDLEESTRSEKLSQYHLDDFHEKVEKSCSLFQKQPLNGLEPLNQYLESKREGMLFDAPLKRIQLPPRKSIFPRKRLHRIPFQSRLETVLEHSPGFSYLFPED